MAVDDKGRRCALKIFKGKHAAECLEHEASMNSLAQTRAKPCDLQWFPQLYFSQVIRRPFPYLAFEYCGSSLQAVLLQGPLEPQAIPIIALQLKSALCVLHRHDVVHLDVKPSNILWSADTFQAKLGDFGMSECTKQPSLKLVNYVTALYRPPELWDVSLRDLAYHLVAAVDVWSYGCVMYECSTARPLMLPMHGNGSTRHTVQVWFRDWQSLGRSSLRQVYAGNDARRLHCRLLRAGCLVPKVLRALQPNPSKRDYGFC